MMRWTFAASLLASLILVGCEGDESIATADAVGEDVTSADTLDPVQDVAPDASEDTVQHADSGSDVGGGDAALDVPDARDTAPVDAFIDAAEVGTDAPNAEGGENVAPTIEIIPFAVGFEDLPLTFGAGSGNGALTISDVDVGAGALRVTLGVDQGTLTLAATNGLVFAAGDGTADGTMTFTGTLAAIDAAVTGLRYVTPGKDWTGDVSFSITVDDQGNTGTGGARVTTKTITIHIQRYEPAPTIHQTSLGPLLAFETTTLKCDASATHVDGEPFWISHNWYVDGVLVPGVNVATLTGAFFAKGQIVTCIVEAVTLRSHPAYATTNAVTIQNSAPTTPTVAITPSPASRKDTLTCVAGASSDADGDTLVQTFAWTKNDVPLGITTPTLASSFFAGGDAIRCVVTVSDGALSASATSAPVVIGRP